MDILNALVLLFNYIIVPSVAYGSQLALGALGLLWSMEPCVSPTLRTAS